jgi:hypothetical protein
MILGPRRNIDSFLPLPRGTFSNRSHLKVKIVCDYGHDGCFPGEKALGNRFLDIFLQDPASPAVGLLSVKFKVQTSVKFKYVTI